MQFTRSAREAVQKVRRTRRRSLVGLMALSALLVLALAPNAFAWHGYLKVKKVVVDSDTARRDGAKFLFKVDRKDTPDSGWAAQVSSFELGNGGSWLSGSWASGGDSASIPWKKFKVTEYGGSYGTSLSDYDTTVVCEKPYKGDNTYENTSYPWNDGWYNWGTWPAPTYGADRSATTELRWGNNYSFITKCTFTNTRKGKIRIQKQWAGAVPQDATAQLKIDGNVVKTATVSDTTSAYQTVAGGSAHTYGENSPGAEYTVSDLGCKDSYGKTVASQGGNVTVPAGADVTCTIKNERKNGKITVKKVTNPESITSGFDLRIDGDVAGTGGNVGNGGTTGAITVPTGLHAVSETATGGGLISGFGSSYECVNEAAQPWVAPNAVQSGTSTTVTVNPGDNWICTFTNTKKGTFKVVKKFTGPSGDDKVNILYGDVKQPVAGTTNLDFGDGDATDVTTVNADTPITFSEQAVPPADLDKYTVDVACVDTAHDDAPVDTTGAYTVTVGPGQDVVCTITNDRKTGTLTVNKVLLPAADSGFDLKIDGAVAGTGGNVGDGGTTGAITVPTGDHTVSEATVGEGDSLSNYVTSLSCANRVPAEQLAPRVAVPVSESGVVTIGPNDDVVCTFTNKKKAKITIKKVTNPVGTGTFSFTGGLGPFDVVAGGDGTSFTVAPDVAYGVTETVPAGYTVEGIVCTDQSPTDGATVTITPNPGDVITCTYTNKADTPVTPPETPGGGVSPVNPDSGSTPTGGTTAKRGSARLKGTVGCATGTFATASVSGSQIRKVTFKINGKTVKTLTKPNNGSRYTLKTRTKRLKVGSYKVTATVQFTTASGTKAKTLRLQFSRCTPRSVRPQFTG